MSRAFVKENDLEHAGIDIPERPLSDEPNYVTPRGLSLLNQTIDDLEKEREALITKKDDPMVKQKIAVIERDMRYFAARIESAILTNPQEEDRSHVLFGAKVTMEDEEAQFLTFEIVGEDEANIKESKISYASPIGRALIGKELDDSIEVKTPGGLIHYEVMEVIYA